MKTLFTLLTLVFLIYVPSHAQFSFGPEIGTNAVVVEKSEIGREYHLCWLAGLNAEYAMTDFFSLRTGAYFSHRKKTYYSADTTSLNIFGFDLEDFGIPGVDFNEYTQTKGIISLFGIEVPLLASLNFKEVSVFAGPYMNFLVGAWSKERTNSQIPFLQTFDIDSLDPSGFVSFLFPDATSTSFSESSSVENMNGFDYGFKTGMSYTNKGFRMNFYYTLGIPDYRIDRGTADVDAHHYFSLSLAYNFKLPEISQSSFGN